MCFLLEGKEYLLVKFLASFWNIFSFLNYCCNSELNLKNNTQNTIGLKTFDTLKKLKYFSFSNLNKKTHQTMSEVEAQIENISFMLNGIREEYNHDLLSVCLQELEVIIKDNICFKKRM